ncbi:L-serine ammonia-lyase, iron-sulfur-dependent subunit beta [Phosphitispora fastidiosa]|uniref:L-serine ammonia-lyase, iron-sulfur-dependent subunit beta n=1 Tax=Phosphitispora fastidiosa TaxID=2837202 RepID=UPI001E580B5A|nr:L-serine ammonia-lyase, iron-sulfur-dependent subunit beta [Phosphitispora fastidiosa]MBU7006452.1 L-serine dehydratase [Phosphitispora fastidiosa]
MTGKSVFEIIGPAMIGPSSSHTAGALRIGRAARLVLGEKPATAEIVLYGSFAKTYRGHGTDRALAAGLLGMNTDDDRIKDALAAASREGLDIVFKIELSGAVHPNTAAIILTGVSGRNVTVEGSSVGGGNIVISRVNQFIVNIRGVYPTLLVEHRDRPGVIGRVTTILGQSGINIASMNVVRKQKGADNLMVIEIDEPVTEEIQKQVAAAPEVIKIIAMNSF